MFNAENFIICSNKEVILMQKYKTKTKVQNKKCTQKSAFFYPNLQNKFPLKLKF